MNYLSRALSVLHGWPLTVNCSELLRNKQGNANNNGTGRPSCHQNAAISIPFTQPGASTRSVCPEMWLPCFILIFIPYS